SEVGLELNNLATALMDQGKYDGVEVLLTEALVIDGGPGGDRSYRIDTLYWLGRLYCETGDRAKAADRLREALGLARKENAKAPRTVALYAEQLADLLSAPEQAKEAMKYYDEALALTEKGQKGGSPEVARLLARAALARLAADDEDRYRAARDRL